MKMHPTVNLVKSIEYAHSVRNNPNTYIVYNTDDKVVLRTRDEAEAQTKAAATGGFIEIRS